MHITLIIHGGNSLCIIQNKGIHFTRNNFKVSVAEVVAGLFFCITAQESLDTEGLNRFISKITYSALDFNSF